jgi:excisionase family DNA binding protein
MQHLHTVPFMTSHHADAYLTPAQACDLLHISRSTLDRYQSSGRIEPVRLPTGHRRFRRSDVEALLVVTP